jgi:ubiquinone/menaquinone biosynthesis C-methylase UbiE
MLGPRIDERERMDDPSVDEGRIRQALRELDVINAYLGGRSTTAKGLGMLAGTCRSDPVTILDVGAGGSSGLATMFKNGRSAKVTSLDVSESVCRYRRENNPLERVLCGDVRSFALRESSFDVVHASLFLHHFADGEIPALLAGFLRIARCGVVINDLQRSGLALAGISALTRLFSRSDLVLHDAPLSVRRGFTRAELAHFCSNLPASSWNLQWSWAFRWLLVIVK